MSENRNVMPRTGLSARRTSRPAPPKMLTAPLMPRNRNQTVMIGPNALPIMDVPARWTRNSALMIATVMTMTIAWLSPMIA